LLMPDEREPSSGLVNQLIVLVFGMASRLVFDFVKAYLERRKTRKEETVVGPDDKPGSC